ncbi:MAG: cupin domain-containing protein [Solirubrobacterales bacterium]|nr:cupin domain-containing protein [Solirubrobacterales bacterium]
MDNDPHQIHNVRTGQRMHFLESDGALLRIETHNPPTGVAEPEHVHPRQESRATVSSGTLLFTVDGVQRRVGPGETLTIPAGTPHYFVNDGSDEAVGIQEFRPALRTEELFRTLFGLAEQGKLDEHGMPSLLTLAALGPKFAEEVRATKPPWALQRIAFALLGPLARRAL